MFVQKAIIGGTTFFHGVNNSAEENKRNKQTDANPK